MKKSVAFPVCPFPFAQWLLRGSPWQSLLILAVLFTVLNGAKPLQVDDTAYYFYARQIAQQPLDPYGFEIFWYQYPHRANAVLAPVAFPYWWALAIRLFGEQPFLWKLWLFPFSLLFVVSLYNLARRFARGMELPLVWMTVLSPTFLPSLNLMLDVPALALSLCSLTLFFGAVEDSKPFIALLAGLMAGLAMQTKYTAFLAPAAMFLFAVAWGSLRFGSSVRSALRSLCLWALAAGLAAAIFVAWEMVIDGLYGESHFLHHYRESREPLLAKAKLFLPLLPIVGGICPAIGLVGLAGLGCRRWVLAGSTALAGVAFLVAAWGETDFWLYLTPSQSLFGITETWVTWCTLDRVFFGLLGLGSATITAAIIWRSCRLSQGRWRQWGRWQARWRDWFLVFWLGLEVAGYFALTPFPAVRRVMGIVVVGTLLAGHLASRTCRGPQRRRLIVWAAAGGIALGLGFYIVDVHDAFAEKNAAEDAAAWVRQQDTHATVWFVGHWGFQYYAERAGMTPVVPGDSVLKRGDWLVVPDNRLNQQTIVIDANRTEEGVEIQVGDALPLRTVQCYYGGRTPLEHHEGPRVSVTIYRVTADFVPPTPTDDETIRKPQPASAEP